MADYFLDTSVLIAYFKNEDPRSVSLVESVLRGDASAVVSAITVAEICSAGAMHDSRIRSKRLATVQLLDVVVIDRAIAERGGELRRAHDLALPDALIAASAEVVGGRFISKDQHFGRLLKAKKLRGEIY